MPLMARVFGGLDVRLARGTVGIRRNGSCADPVDLTPHESWNIIWQGVHGGPADDDVSGQPPGGKLRRKHTQERENQPEPLLHFDRLCHEMGSIIGAMKRAIFLVVFVAGVALLQSTTHAEDQAYKLVEGWGPLPAGVTWGEVPAMTIDKEGRILAFHRNEPNVIEFDQAGKVLKTWGNGFV